MSLRIRPADTLAWSGYILFFTILFLPTTYQAIKAALLMLVLSGIVVGLFRRGSVPLHPSVLAWTLFFVAIGLFFMIRGLLLGAPGALRVGTVYALWPLVYTILVAGTASERALRGLTRVLIVAAVAIGLYGFNYLLFTAGILPESLYLPLDQGQGIGFYRGFIEVNLYSLAALLFLLPFLLSALLCWKRPLTPPASRGSIWLAVVLSVALALVSGRRALLLILAFSPLMALLTWAFLRTSFRIKARFLLLFLIGVLTIGFSVTLYLKTNFDFSWYAVLAMFREGFDLSSGGEGPAARAQQFNALIKAWSGTPLLGSGHGASASGIVRSAEMPWAYELSYVALLYHTGLIGFLAYASGVVWIYWMGFRLIRSGHRSSLLMAPALAGMTGFLIGNATNPYLAKYDYIWVIFLPVAIINHWLLTRHEAPPLCAPLST